MDKIKISEVKEKIINGEWSYSVYSETLKALYDELYYALKDYEHKKRYKKHKIDNENDKDDLNIDIYFEQSERVINDFLFELKEEQAWINFIPCIYNHIVEAYKKDLFRLKFEVEKKVIYISLKVNPDKIDDFLKYIADNYYDVNIEDNHYNYIDQIVYKILDIIANAIKEWDKRYCIFF